MRSDAPGPEGLDHGLRHRRRRGGRRGGRGGNSFSQTAELGTEWKPVSVSFTLPNDWTAPSLVRSHRASPRQGQLWVDDVRLVAGDGRAQAALTLCDKIGVSPQPLRTGNLFFAGQHGTGDPGHRQRR